MLNSAEPNGKLEVLDGEKVVTTANVDATGDFAAVLDDPLPAGDHQLVLKFTGKDGKSMLSEEVATISVPKDGNGANLLAMVSKPGAASRIITAPKAGTEVADASNPMAPPADKPKQRAKARLRLLQHLHQPASWRCRRRTSPTPPPMAQLRHRIRPMCPM